MLETYKGTLRGNQIAWKGKIPDILDEEVEVEVTIVNEEGRSQAERPIGLAKGEFAVPDNFDAPLPDDILDDFEN